MKQKNNIQNQLLLTGGLGLLAAVLVGWGEFLMHFDPLARFSQDGYDFLLNVSAERATLGHFLGVFGATLYPVGMYHIYLMLRPAHQTLAFIAFLLGSFGFMVGAVWLGSRASIAAIVQLPEAASLIELYQLRYESLLSVIRFTTLALSLIFIGLTLTGKTYYPKWMAIFNPIVLLVANFVVFAVEPEVGKYVMPIALNVGFFIFFALSLLFVRRSEINSY